MDQNAAKITGTLVAFGIAITLPLVTLGNQKMKVDRMEPTADSIWKILNSSMYLKGENIDACRAEADCFAQVADKWRKAETPQKIQALGGFVDLGGQLKPAFGENPRRYGPYLVEEHLIEAVVEALMHEDQELRNLACRILARETPDTLVRDHSLAIESALKKHPDLRDGARLVGKLANNRAWKLLKSSKALQDDDSLVVSAAFGKLGDFHREVELIEAYRAEADLREKETFALLLGYIAKPKSLLVLARDLRSPLFYTWNQKGRRSFRLHVIEALSLAYPMEPLLWKPGSYPRNDEYYVEIEAWAQRVLGVEWSAPRPPFLYEEQVPLAKPMKR